MALLKVFLCLLLVAAVAAQDSEDGQYSPEKYEKPYEAEESVTPAAEEEAAETPDPIESAETPEPVVEVSDPVPAPAVGLPGVVAAKPVPFPVPYPLLYNSISAPVVYPDPQIFNFAGAFPVVAI